MAVNVSYRLSQYGSHMKKFAVAFRLFTLLYCLISFSANIYAQSLDSTLERYANHYQPERAYLHYDKASYSPGETIWFKAYLMEGIFPADGSKTFYTDWIADDGTVLQHTVSPIVEAMTNGQFDIPSTYSGNYIHVRAYTKWMLNFDTAFLYNKDIRILKKSAPASKVARPAIIPTLQFFPEGGDAIAGVLNRIAFKANDQWGRPVRVRGVITGNGAVIDSFKSVHDGMGFILLTPQPGNTYTARWKDEKGTEHSTDLPAIRPGGIAMEVLLGGTKRYIRLTCSNNAPDNLKQLHIIGTLNRHIAFKTDIALTPGVTGQRIIPTENIASGILTITVFDALWNAVAERVTFINNHEYAFSASMEVQHWGLNKRAKNEVQISIPDSVSSANLSVSVTDASIEKDTSDNIISHLLLTSDIKGYVYKPYYYFSDNSDTSAQNLDLVMLTHGWRRFKWEDIMKGKFPAITYPKDTTYLTLSGKVLGVAKSQFSGSDNIALIVKDKNNGNKILAMPINSNGTFGDPNLIFFDTLQVYYHLKSKFFGNAEANFMTGRLPAPNYSVLSKNFLHSDPYYIDTSGYAHHLTLASEATHLQELEKGKMMEAVTVTAKTKSPVQQLEDKYTSGLFKGGDGYQFDLINDPSTGGYMNIFNYLQGKVAGLQISTSNTGTPTLQWRGSTPTLFVDEMQIDPSMVSSIPVTDIAYVKVLRPPFLGAPGGGAGGAIAIYTRKGNDIQNKPGSGLDKNLIAGYTPIRQFYAPNYATFNQRNEQPDMRTTLFWDPNLKTDPHTHKVTFIFYNNDLTKSFRVIVEGMTKEGLLTHLEQTME